MYHHEDAMKTSSTKNVKGQMGTFTGSKKSVKPAVGKVVSSKKKC